MAIQYKCPSCGAPLVYSADTKKLSCHSCGFSKEVPDFEYKTFSELNGASAKTYACSSCGATLITDEHTSATFCSFCGSPTLIEDRLLNEVRPSGVIPFTVTKEEATAIFKKWTQKGFLTPGLLKKESTVEKLTGMYVPFWIYDYDARTMMVAKCTKSTSHREGDYQVTHTHHYVVTRDVEAGYNMIPADASEKMEDGVMDKLEPYAYKELVPFEMPYLSGFYAEKYNYQGEELLDRIKARVTQYITASAKETIGGYDTVNIVENNITGKCVDMEYVLMPVWTLFYRWNKKEYMFTINGQTGKVVADRPVDALKTTISFFVIFAIVFLLLFIGGGLLF